MDDEVRPPPFFRVRHLLAQDRLKFLRSHRGATEYPLALQKGRGGDHDDGVAAALAAGLEQQRNIEGDQRQAPPRRPPEERLLGVAHQRMQDGFEPPEGGSVAEHPCAEGAPVDRPVDDHARERRRDWRHGPTAAAEQAVHHGIGIMDGDAEAAKLRGRGALAHADRTGEADDDHRYVSRSTSARRSGVTSGSTPNQAAKAGRAW